MRAECGSTPAPPSSVGLTVDEVVGCLNRLESLCPDREDYSALCLLLTLPRLSDHRDYMDWNPSNARVQCFKVGRIRRVQNLCHGGANEPVLAICADLNICFLEAS